MTLNAYLAKRGESRTAFARRADIPQRTMNRVCNGEGCRAATAHAIITASEDSPTDGGGTITLAELVVDEGAGAEA